MRATQSNKPPMSISSSSAAGGGGGGGGASFFLLSPPFFYSVGALLWAGAGPLPTLPKNSVTFLLPRVLAKALTRD